MRSVKQIVTAPIVSPWKGSETTYKDVKEQIRARWGDKVAEEYSPKTDVAPFSTWASSGLHVRHGEKALKSITLLDAKGPNGEMKKIRRVVNLFHRLQVSL